MVAHSSTIIESQPICNPFFHNRRNHKELLPRNGLDSKMAQKCRFPQSVMVWAGICATGSLGTKTMDPWAQQQWCWPELVPLHPWAQQHFGKTKFTLQQNWAPSHWAKTMIDLCEELFPDFWGKDIWPSNSTDLNDMDSQFGHDQGDHFTLFIGHLPYF